MIDGGEKFRLPKPYDKDKLKNYIDTLENEYSIKSQKIEKLRARVDNANAQDPKDLYHIWKDIYKLDKNEKLDLWWEIVEN